MRKLWTILMSLLLAVTLSAGTASFLTGCETEEEPLEDVEDDAEDLDDDLDDVGD